MQLANPIPTLSAPPQTELLSFLCPCCAQRLIVSVELSGVVGPCPVCAKTIRAPFSNHVEPETALSQTITTSQTILPTPPMEQPNSSEVFEEIEEVTPRAEFSASFCIEGPSQDELDDSWKARYERERGQTKKRQKRDRLIWSLFYSKGARKFQKIGIGVLTGILVATAIVLYLNRRTGGALLNRVFGN